MFFKFILMFIFISNYVCATFLPLREIDSLKEIKEEYVYALKNVNVVLADYELLKKDFSSLKNLTHQEIDNWLIKKAGFISVPQAKQTIVNSNISVNKDIKKIAYRPFAYGRALIFDSEEEGFLDVKGVGSLNPTQISHGNGLSTLGESMREFVYEKLVKSIFEYTVSPYDTVGCYAVLAFDFFIKHNDGQKSLAGAVLRQAHDRFQHKQDKKNKYYNFLPQEKAKEIELILRKFGITSTGALDNISIADIQGTSNCDIVDFGTFLVVENFTVEKVNFLSGKNIAIEEDEILQPDKTISVPFDIWGYDKKRLSKYDKPRFLAEFYAFCLSKGRLKHSQLKHFCFLMLSPVFKKWDFKQGLDKINSYRSEEHTSELQSH